MIKQRTIRESVSIDGVGLQTGKKVTLSLKNSPVNSGINFIRVDLPNKPVLNIQSLDLKRSGFLQRRTTLGTGPLQIQTTEHFLAALSALSIDNILVEMDSEELPGLDGSAKGFFDLIRKAEPVEQDAPRKIVDIKEEIGCKGNGSSLTVFPDDNFRVSYTMSYSNPVLGDQFLSLVVNEKNFETEIAPARTFCLEEEAAVLLKSGLGKGASYENTLVIGKNGPVKNTLRFKDEPVRHKILDLIGDLYVLGMPIKGHVVAKKSGHKLNMELVKKLKQLAG